MLMKLYIQDFVEPKTTKDEVCDALQDVYQDDEWGNRENRKALPDTAAIQKQGGALSKQQEIGRKQTCWYKKKDAKR